MDTFYITPENTNKDRDGSDFANLKSRQILVYKGWHEYDQIK